MSGGGCESDHLPQTRCGRSDCHEEKGHQVPRPQLGRIPDFFWDGHDGTLKVVETKNLRPTGAQDWHRKEYTAQLHCWVT